MPKAIFVAPPLSGAEIPAGGIDVKVVSVRRVQGQWTSIGTLKDGLGIEVEYQGAKYSQLFSLDRELLTGSIGRILVSLGIEDTSDKAFESKVQALVGKTIKVVKKGGKLYWYP
jgi:hypothetical protein